MEGELAYLSPTFEEPKTRAYLKFGEDIRCWEEHEDPTALVIETVRSMGLDSGAIAIDPATPFFTVDGLRKAGNSFSFVNASSITAACRQVKSASGDRADAGGDEHHDGGAQGDGALHGGGS